MSVPFRAEASRAHRPSRASWPTAATRNLPERATARPLTKPRTGSEARGVSVAAGAPDWYCQRRTRPSPAPLACTARHRLTTKGYDHKTPIRTPFDRRHRSPAPQVTHCSRRSPCLQEPQQCDITCSHALHKAHTAVGGHPACMSHGGVKLRAAMVQRDDATRSLAWTTGLHSRRGAKRKPNPRGHRPPKDRASVVPSLCTAGALAPAVRQGRDSITRIDASSAENNPATCHSATYAQLY